MWSECKIISKHSLISEFLNFHKNFSHFTSFPSMLWSACNTSTMGNAFICSKYKWNGRSNVSAVSYLIRSVKSKWRSWNRNVVFCWRILKHRCFITIELFLCDKTIIACAFILWIERHNGMRYEYVEANTYIYFVAYRALASKFCNNCGSVSTSSDKSSPNSSCLWYAFDVLPISFISLLAMKLCSSNVTLVSWSSPVQLK